MIFRLKYLYFGANYKEISFPFLIPISPIPCKNCPWMKTAIAIPSLSFPFFSNKRDFERENCGRMYDEIEIEIIWKYIFKRKRILRRN